MHFFINLDHSLLEEKLLAFLAKKYHQRKKNLIVSNVWFDGKFDGAERADRIMQILEDWSSQKDKRLWPRVRVIVVIARRDIDIQALRLIRAFYLLKTGRVPDIQWLTGAIEEPKYRRIIEQKTHPGVLALEAIPGFPSTHRYVESTEFEANKMYFVQNGLEIVYAGKSASAGKNPVFVYWLAWFWKLGYPEQRELGRVQGKNYQPFEIVKQQAIAAGCTLPLEGPWREAEPPEDFYD